MLRLPSWGSASAFTHPPCCADAPPAILGKRFCLHTPSVLCRCSACHLGEALLPSHTLRVVQMLRLPSWGSASAFTHPPCCADAPPAILGKRFCLHTPSMLCRCSACHLGEALLP